MQRSLVLALILLFCGMLAAAWWLMRGGDEPPPMPAPLPIAAQPAAVGATGAAGEVKAMPGTGGALHREVVAELAAELLDDPDIRAGLCGFKGRVVGHDKAPVASTIVRIYRGAMDSVLPANFDLFAAESTYTPNYVAGETTTAADGTWQLTGVWPRAFYLLFAGLGSDAPAHQVVTRVPSPGEIVDLGDIVLPDAGVITGTVVDENGEPLAGALVRAADLPGTLAAFFPVERFDPEGALLIREPGPPVRVVVMPPWVKGAFEQLPIPTTRTDGDGRFRLVGVVPGSNLLATTLREYLSDMKPSVQVRAGQEKDVGRIKLKRGEELTGRVVDSAGKPIANAEILAGSTVSIAPVDLAQRLGHSDADGRFQGQGFAPGKVSVAARRGKGHPWVLAEPQPVLGDVVVTLPATFAVDVTLTQGDGTPVKAARLQLLPGKPGEGAVEMNLMGFSPPVDLRERSRETGEGRWRLDNLGAGSYVLLADAPGFATSFAPFQIEGTDTTVALQLHPPRLFTVRVADVDDKPIRNAAIYAEARGEELMEMPVMCGRTGADGRLVIDKVPAESVRVSAEHPRWGVVHGEVKAGEEVLLRMQPPGSLRGTLREDGKVPPLAKYTVAVTRQRGDGEGHGPIETAPMLVTPDAEGVFTVKALQPGRYQVAAVQGLNALRSPGGVMTLAQEAFMQRDQHEESVQVISGQTADVTLEAGEKPIEGPTARVSGSVTVDGRLAVGYVVTGYSNLSRAVAKVDERGRFDLGVVAAGHLWIGVSSASDGFFLGNTQNIWSSGLELKEGELRDLTIDVLTSSISGICIGPDGAPKGGLYVQGRGKLKGAEERGEVWIGVPANADGEFRFAQVAEGKWTLTVRADERDETNAVRGTIADVEVVGGMPVTGLRLELKAAPMVRGRVDLAAIDVKDAQWSWLGFSKLKPEDPEDGNGDWSGGASVDTSTGAFATSDVEPGRYRVRLWIGRAENRQDEFPCGVVVVAENGASDLLLQPGPRAGGR